MPPKPLLTPEQKTEIYWRYTHGEKNQEKLAYDYGVGQSTVSRAIKDEKDRLEALRDN
ncbi:MULTISPECIES: hypothetical protein [Kordiimonas]|jgi:DNA-binding transcriptional regulator LsrR (DeoR family)|uniref:hypothetical protein n=1 Tax=Kordiimonas TaxID=288021 RepID=UPI00257F23D5|nr:hypothetical protein [Kordiimonas sp. UBA4487]